MQCRICGDENAEWAGGNRGMLCGHCLKDTPRKVSFFGFCNEYFRGCQDVPESTKREFYEDYRCSKHDLAEYIERTRGDL